MATPGTKGAIAEAVIAAEAIKPAANRQELAIRYAEPYRLPGAIAQLGERRAGSAKVEGSSPSSSTPQAA
jgi:hypothetical protein